VLIAERFLLLSLDPAHGTLAISRDRADPGALCAAALFLELVVQRRLHLRPPNLVLEDRLPPAHPLLDAAAKALHDRTGEGVANAIARVERRLSPLPVRLLEGLVRRDFLHRVHDWRFWRADALRFPLRSWQARNEASRTLAQAALAPGDTAGIALLMLCDLAGTLTAHLDAQAHERAAATLLSLDGELAHDDAERYTLAAVRRALLES
jgi:hypothetical protein